MYAYTSTKTGEVLVDQERKRRMSTGTGFRMNTIGAISGNYDPIQPEETDLIRELSKCV